MVVTDDPRPSNIVLVRHGESAWNAWGKEKKRRGIPPPGMQDVPDHRTPLTACGIEQARQTGKELYEQFGAFDVMFYSPYVRARHTAEIIREHMPETTRFYRDLLLVEQQFGFLDPSVASSREEYVELQHIYEAYKKKVGKFYAIPPNGESWFNVCLRTHDFLDKLFRPYWHGKNILIVSHAVTIATFYYHLQGRDEESAVENYERNRVSNCGVVHFRHNPDPAVRPRWEIVCWNKIFWR